MTSSDGGRVLSTNLRDFFFTDPFFKSSWDDFDSLRKEMMRESRDFWSSVEKDMKQMESFMSSSSSFSSSKSIEDKRNTSSSLNSSSTKGGALVPAGESGDAWSPWFFPRRWMLPRLFGAEDDSKMRSLDLFQHKDEQVRLSSRLPVHY